MIVQKFKKLLSLLAAFLLLNYVAHSQVGNMFVENIDTTNKKIFNIDEIVVSAKGWKQNKTDISFPI